MPSASPPLFNALASAGALVANYPFATIEPNTGVVTVPDPRLDALTGIVQPERTIPAAVEFVDIAGLVKGASQSEGLGKQFLANIREVGAIVHVIRCFDDDDVQHIMGPVDPVRDREVVHIELELADLASVEKRLDKTARTAKSGDPQAKLEARLLTALKDALANGKPARSVVPSDEERVTYRGFNLLTSKPVLYAADVDFETGFIRAETVSYADFVRVDGWKGAREQGLARAEGKDYVVQDGDVMLFRFSTSAARRREVTVPEPTQEVAHSRRIPPLAAESPATEPPSRRISAAHPPNGRQPLRHIERRHVQVHA